MWEISNCIMRFGCVLCRVKANALLNFSGALQGKKEKKPTNKNDLSWLCLRPQ